MTDCKILPNQPVIGTNIEYSFKTHLNTKTPNPNDVQELRQANTPLNECKTSERRKSCSQILTGRSAKMPQLFDTISPISHSNSMQSVKSDSKKIKFPGIEYYKHMARTPISTKSVISSDGQFDLAEIEYLIREKARRKFCELRHNFIINDPLGKGYLRREALGRVITRLLFWPVQPKHVDRLLTRLGFSKNKQIINFTEFYLALFPQFDHNSSSADDQQRASLKLNQIAKTHLIIPDEERPRSTKCTPAKINNGDLEQSTHSCFMTEIPDDTLKHSGAKPSVLLAHQVMGKLRSNLHEGSTRITELIELSSANQNAENYVKHLPNIQIDKNCLYCSLKKIGLGMSENEFHKFWKRLAPQNEKGITLDNFIHHLNLNVQELIPKQNETIYGTIEQYSNNSSKLLTSDNLMAFLLERFRRGFRRACKAVKICNQKAKSTSESSNNDCVQPDVFLNSLNYLHLPVLDRAQLKAFLTRHGLTLNQKGLVPYRELFCRFQNRSEAGVAHQVLTDALIHVGNAFIKLTDNKIFQVEKELVRMFHSEFLLLLNTFRTFDTDRSGVVSPDQFRQILFTQYGYEFDNNCFANVVDCLPLNKNGLVNYGEFMRQFDSEINLSKISIDDIDINKNTKKRPKSTKKHIALCTVNDTPLEYDNSTKKCKNLDEVRQKICHLLSKNLKNIEQTFHELDEFNSGKMTQEQLFQLLSKCDDHKFGTVTRGDIRQLWSDFIVDRKEHLEFHEFIRHFLYKKKEAAYPNAKLVPPRLGDADLMPYSNKLNGETCLIKNSLNSKMDLLYPRLCLEFAEMDPHKTGYITHQQLNDLLIELCLQVSDRELEELVNKFDVNKDGTISYLAMLNPFAKKRAASKRFELPAKSKLTNVHRARVTQSKLYQVAPRKQNQLLQLKWSKMQRSMRQADETGCGRLAAPVFRNIYHEMAGIRLTDEQIYSLLTSLDPQVSGTLPYTRLIQQLQKSPNTNLSKI